MTTRPGAAPWKAGPVEPDPVEIALAPTSPDALVADLYRAQYRALVGRASLVVDRRAEAEEIVQEAFVRLYASWGTLRDPERALGYLRATVLNLARSGIRRRVVARRYIAAHGDDVPVAAPPADELADLAADVRLPEPGSHRVPHRHRPMRRCRPSRRRRARSRHRRRATTRPAR